MKLNILDSKGPSVSLKCVYEGQPAPDLCYHDDNGITMAFTITDGRTITMTMSRDEFLYMLDAQTANCHCTVPHAS